MTSFTLDILDYDGWITSRHDISIPVGEDVMPAALQILKDYPNEQSASLSRNGKTLADFTRENVGGDWQFDNYAVT